MLNLIAISVANTIYIKLDGSAVQQQRFGYWLVVATASAAQILANQLQFLLHLIIVLQLECLFFVVHNLLRQMKLLMIAWRVFETKRCSQDN